MSLFIDLVVCYQPSRMSAGSGFCFSLSLVLGIISGIIIMERQMSLTNQSSCPMHDPRNFELFVLVPEN